MSGSQPSFADFLLYEMLVTLTYLDASLLEGHAHLKKLVESIEQRPAVQEYLKSGRRPWKVNGNSFGTPQEFLDQAETA